MDISFNQAQYLRSAKTRIKCRMCKKQIIWMRTTEGRTLAVDPIKLINSTPGVRILGEDGVTEVNNSRKIGWKYHDCVPVERRLGSASSSEAAQ